MNDNGSDGITTVEVVAEIVEETNVMHSATTIEQMLRQPECLVAKHQTLTDQALQGRGKGAVLAQQQLD